LVKLGFDFSNRFLETRALAVLFLNQFIYICKKIYPYERKVMVTDLGFIDIELPVSNNLFNTAVNLGSLQGTNTATGVISPISSSQAQFNDIDFYRFTLDTKAPLNSYIELYALDIIQRQAIYRIDLYQYDAVNDRYSALSSSSQYPNNPFHYRIDLASLAKGTYVFGVTGIGGNFASGFYKLRLSIPTTSQPGVVIKGNNNNNVLNGGTEENTINGLGGNDTLNGGKGDDTLVGGEGDDDLSGGTEEDPLNNGVGNDLLNGGIGLDLVVESGNFSQFILTNQRLIASGIDTLVSIEQAVLTGGEGDNKIDASAFTLGSVVLDGGTAGNDTLLGGTKNDFLIGSGVEGDYLDGGIGSDTLIGSLGGDTFIIDNLGDKVIQDPDDPGFDTVQSSITYTLRATLENLILTGLIAINGTGNALDNNITGNSNSNRLTGGIGNDRLDGREGVDTLIGGIGNDTYFVDNTLDIIIEGAQAERDIVKASASYTLSANLENLELSGAFVGHGNSLNNHIDGFGSDYTLNGQSGDDTLWSFGSMLLLKMKMMS
jgi:Ca2+-binding RTX toxin-like protein